MSERPAKRIKVSDDDDDKMELSKPSKPENKPPASPEAKKPVPARFRPLYENIQTYPIATAPHRIPFEQTETWKNYLRENGYVVVSGVMTEEKVADINCKVWDFLESIGTGIQRNDKRTWINANWPNTFSNGIISQYGVGQSEASWAVRTDPRVRQVYEEIFGTDELLVSFDGINVFRPPSASPDSKEKWVTTGVWPHLDQNYFLSDAYKRSGVSVQGAMNLLESGPEDGGFICIPGSNKLFEHIYTTYNFGTKIKRHFVQMDPKHEMWTQDEKLARLSCVKVSAAPGDLILWDSTTLHWNTPVTNLGKQYQTLARAAVYVCMAPKRQVRRPGEYETLLQQRRDAVANFKTTSHWPIFCYVTPPPRWPRKAPLKPIDSKGPCIVAPSSTTKAARHLIEGTSPH